MLLEPLVAPTLNFINDKTFSNGLSVGTRFVSVDLRNKKSKSGKPFTDALSSPAKSKFGRSESSLDKDQELYD
jgi:hypothetical protein